MRNARLVERSAEMNQSEVNVTQEIRVISSKLVGKVLISHCK